MPKSAPNQYEHLAPEVRPLMAMSVEARLQFLDEDCFIEHPAATRILEKLEGLVTKPTSRRPAGICLVARSSMGKTTLLEELERRHPATEKPEGNYANVPVLRIQFHERGGDKIWGSITSALNVVLPSSATVEKKREAALHFMNEMNVRVLVVDELANALGTTTLKQGLALTTIKTIMNTLGRPVVVAATPNVHSVIRGEEQIYRRFEVLLLQEFEYGPAFLKFLRGWEAVLPIEFASGLGTNKDLAKRIYGITRGLTGDIEKLLKQAAAKAIKEGQPITLELLDEIGFVTPSDEEEAVKMMLRRA